MNEQHNDLIGFTAEIAVAFAANQRATAEEIAALVPLVYGAFSGLAAAAEPVPTADEPTHIPAVSIRASVKHDHLISLIDGKPYKSLKRHLAGHGLTPEQYRERYGLKGDYPMVSAGYTEVRRELAKKIGLGRNGGGKRRGAAKR